MKRLFLSLLSIALISVAQAQEQKTLQEKILGRSNTSRYHTLRYGWQKGECGRVKQRWKSNSSQFWPLGVCLAKRNSATYRNCMMNGKRNTTCRL